MSVNVVVVESALSLFTLVSIVKSYRPLFMLTCLCFGFFEQTTYILPFLFTMLQPSHMVFTDDRTFIPLANAGITEVDGWW